jgi:hypothetical protein
MAAATSAAPKSSLRASDVHSAKIAFRSFNFAVHSFPVLDALKFAFEILVVAALALPWLAIVRRMFPADEESSLNFYLSVLPDTAESALKLAIVVAFGYAFGSAITRISRNFFNDELWRGVPTEHLIRDAVYMDTYCKGHLIRDLYLPFSVEPKLSPTSGSTVTFVLCPNSIPVPKIAAHPTSESSQAEEEYLTSNPRDDGLYTMTKGQNTISVPYSKVMQAARAGFDASPAERDRYDRNQMADFPNRVAEMFRLQEGLLLLEGQDKVNRLKEYFDQISVLRGATFNGFILCAVCAFGICGNWKLRWAGHGILKFVPYLPPALVVLFGAWSFYGHLRTWQILTSPTDRFYSHPPLTELVFMLLGTLGLFIVFKADQIRPYVRTCVLAAVVTLVSFCGWWWTEIMYDTQVIHSRPALAAAEAIEAASPDTSGVKPPTEQPASPAAPSSPQSTSTRQ